MKRTIAVIISLFLFGIIALPQSALTITIDRIADGGTAPVEQRAGRCGVFFECGLLGISDLYLREISTPDGGIGIPLGAGLYYSVSERATGGIEAAYTPFPEWFHLWGAHQSWSMVEFSAHLKYNFSPFAGAHLYWKSGLKMARLKGSETPGEGLFGGTVGSDLHIKTAYAPGWELAAGITGTPSKKQFAAYFEIAFSYIHMKGKDVRVTGEGADWRYPSDVKLFGIRTGVLFSI
jgi:hypothetical protein